MTTGQFGVPSGNKALIFLTANAATGEGLIEDCKQLAVTLLEKLPGPDRSASVMTTIRFDPFRLFSQSLGNDVTIELRAPVDASAFVAALQGLAADLPESVSREASDTVLLVGEEHWFIPADPQPVSYQYLMRRRKDLTHEAYAAHYGNVHSKFGFKTRGIEGYSQFHVDPEASAEIIACSGIGRCDFDGVSQLTLSALSRFVSAIPKNAMIGAAQDEENFVDRKTSPMLTSRVVCRI